jgi:hypothetical protein
MLDLVGLGILAGVVPVYLGITAALVLRRALPRTWEAGLIGRRGRGGSGWLDSLGHSLSGAWRIADYAAVRRVVRLSAYTWSGVWPSSA